MDESQAQASESGSEPEPAARGGQAVIKRRWAILRNAGGGVAVIAVAGALALSDPSDQLDSGDPGGGGDTEISAEA